MRRETIFRKQTELENLKEKKRRAELNCQIQMVVPQKIVEIPLTGKVSDFENAILISRSVVDEINKEIQVRLWY